MAKNRRANSVLFGFDFQVNAAIVLMLENIKDMDSLRLESDSEDIEIFLSNGKSILAQAKAVEKSSSDFTNVRKNLKKALESLSEGSHKGCVEKLILITNSPNPLNDENSRSVFYGEAHRSYSSLPDSAKKIIDDYLTKMANPLNTDDFLIQVLPFETDDEDERYKVVYQKVNEFVNPLLNGRGKELLNVWFESIFDNGSKKDSSIVLSKRAIVWPLIVLATDVQKSISKIVEVFELDDGQVNDVICKYKDFIDYSCERYEFTTKVLSDFVGYKKNNHDTTVCRDFANNYCVQYLSVLNLDDNEENNILTKIILYLIVVNRYDVERIKKGANL